MASATWTVLISSSSSSLHRKRILTRYVRSIRVEYAKQQLIHSSASLSRASSLVPARYSPYLPSTQLGQNNKTVENFHSNHLIVSRPVYARTVSANIVVPLAKIGNKYNGNFRIRLGALPSTLRLFGSSVHCAAFHCRDNGYSESLLFCAQRFLYAFQKSEEIFRIVIFLEAWINTLLVFEFFWWCLLMVFRWSWNMKYLSKSKG